jgi:hypothetical protein
MNRLTQVMSDCSFFRASIQAIRAPAACTDRSLDALLIQADPFTSGKPQNDDPDYEGRQDFDVHGLLSSRRQHPDLSGGDSAFVADNPGIRMDHCHNLTAGNRPE